MSDSVLVRPARPDDIELIFGMIVALAEYERAPGSVRGTRALLDRALFGAAPVAEAVIAERGGAAVGFVLFYATFSTWECLPGLWIEDLYVPLEHRRAGVGEALLRHVARTAIERGCARVEWAALDWNEPALSFYDKLGAQALHEWKLHRLSDEALAAVGGS